MRESTGHGVHQPPRVACLDGLGLNEIESTRRLTRGGNLCSLPACSRPRSSQCQTGTRYAMEGRDGGKLVTFARVPDRGHARPGDEAGSRTGTLLLRSRIGRGAVTIKPPPTINGAAGLFGSSKTKGCTGDPRRYQLSSIGVYRHHRHGAFTTLSAE